MLERMLARQPQDYAVLYIDMDSFFASAEQQRRPELRGRPVGVSPYGGVNGCVVAASREAKCRGVRAGMRGADARRLVPSITFVRDTPHYYRLLHAKILKILDSTPCQVQARGIDEMRLSIPSYLQNDRDTAELITYIKEGLNRQLGECVTASIGIAANQWQAKLAATARKPNGALVLPQSDREDFYSQIPLLACTGINYRYRRQLFKAGIFNTSQLYQAQEPFLRQHFGINGTKWYLRLRGYEVDDRPVKDKQSIGHQTTLMPRPAGSYEELRSVLIKMALKVGYRLRASGRQAGGLAISLSHDGRGGWSRIQRHLPAFSAQASFVEHIEQILEAFRDSFQPIRRATLVSFDLRPQGQLSFLHEEKLEIEDHLSEAFDSIRERFGPQALQLASSFSDDLFPDRVGFGVPESLFVPSGNA